MPVALKVRDRVVEPGLQPLVTVDDPVNRPSSDDPPVLFSQLA
jgi:hypothetical protein